MEEKRIKNVLINTPKVDMKNLYTELVQKYNRKEEKGLICPQIVIEQEIENEYLIKEDNLPAIIFQKGLPEERILRIYDDVVKHFKFYPSSEFDDIHDTILNYSLALRVSDFLKIDCPQLLVVSEMEQIKNMSGLAIPCENGNNIGMILLKSGRIFAWKVKTLVHELRHVWQHQYHHKIYFSDYKFYDRFSPFEKEKYSLQKAEIDADAFAYRFMNECLEIPIRIEGFSSCQKVRDTIKERANKMCLKFKTA